jgi:hypothetical protein
MISTDNSTICYANDGLIAGTDKDKVQECVNLISYLFYFFGLDIDPDKTKSLIGCPSSKATLYLPPPSTDATPGRTRNTRLLTGRQFHAKYAASSYNGDK